MPIILINKICVLFGARFCSNILLGVNNVKAYLMQVALNKKINVAITFLEFGLQLYMRFH